MNNTWPKRMITRRLPFCFVATLHLVTNAAHSADVISTWNNTIGNWSDASRWSSTDFPNNGNGGFTYDAVVNGGTITLDQDIEIEALTFTTGIIEGDFDLDVNAASSWSGGTHRGAGTTTFNGPLTITGLHNLQDTRTINLAGATTFNGQNFFINSAVGATINNQSGATLGIDGGSDLLGGTFNNAGTINKTFDNEMGDGLTLFSGVFNSTGTVNVNGGEIRLTGGGTHAGDYNVAADGILSFNNGAHNINDGTTIDGDGITNFNSNNVVFNTATFDLNTVVTQTGGIISSDGTLNFNLDFTWSGGSQAGAGVSNFNAPVTITGLHNLQDTRTLNFADSTTYNGGTNQFINSAAGATINFLEGSTLEIDGNSDLLGGTLNNAGTINKSAGDSGDGITLFSGAFNNSGVVNINSGEIRLTGGGTHTSDYNVAADGLLSFNNGVHNINDGTTIDGDGITNFNSNNVMFNTATFELDTLASQTGGVIFGDGTVNFNQDFNWSGGSQGGAGVSNFNGPVTITGLHNLQDTRTLNFADSTTYNGGNNQFISSAAGATINFLEGSTLEIDGNSDLLGGTLTNAGTINKSAGDSGDGITLFSGMFTNTGTINIDSGEVRLTTVFTNYDAATDTITGGTYSVTGTFRFQNADINTNQASITLNGPGSQIISHTLVDALLDFATNDTDAFFGVVGNRDFTTTAATFTNRGQVQLGGGMFTAPILNNEAGGEIFGFGTIVPRPTNAGTIRAAGGTLTIPLGIQGGSGTVQIDAGATLNLSAAGTGSSADTLTHNGTSLNLGANNFSVDVDYNNANFGVGNAFNARANVTGAGQINASPGVAQSLGGNVTGGGATVTMAFGNVHVGDSPTLNYEIGNVTPGIGGPSLRGAVQTTVGGANLTDPRLTGAGVTAGNFGPIPVGESSGNRAVTFNATTAGALTGQQVRIVNNFDNVGNQTLQLTGAAYRFANPTPLPPVVIDFGIIHVGDTVSETLPITNNVPNDGFSERLDASIGSPTGDATTNNGSFSSLNPGSTNDNSLVVGVDTATAGTKSGTATISLTSNGTGTSGLGNTALDDQIVNITAQVNNFAATNVVKLGGHGTFGASGANQFTLDLGSVVQGQDITTELGVVNTAAAPADSLAGSFTPSAPNFTLTGFGAFSGLAAGNTHGGLSIELDTSTAGTLAGQITLQPQSTNSRPFSMNLPPITILLAAEVTLAGDYNDDGVIDAADYTVWRDTGGTPQQFAAWKQNFGATAAAGGGAAASAAVPEPASAVLWVVAGVAAWAKRRRKRGVIHA